MEFKSLFNWFVLSVFCNNVSDLHDRFVDILVVVCIRYVSLLAIRFLTFDNMSWYSYIYQIVSTDVVLIDYELLICKTGTASHCSCAGYGSSSIACLQDRNRITPLICRTGTTPYCSSAGQWPSHTTHLQAINHIKPLICRTGTISHIVHL